MQRKNSRRFTNNSRENDEQGLGDYQQKNQQRQQSSSRYENRAEDSDSIIADMAQGFMQAQAKMTDHGGNINNIEIALLLQKINNQLDEMKKTTEKSPGQSLQQQNSSDKSAQNNKQEPEEQATGDLESLLQSVLQNTDNKSNGKAASKEQSSNAAEGDSQQKKMTVQTVSQVLAQAQYELANELESSLKKLKQVISESEKLANNISNLLGEETSKK